MRKNVARQIHPCSLLHSLSIVLIKLTESQHMILPVEAVRVLYCVTSIRTATLARNMGLLSG